MSDRQTHRHRRPLSRLPTRALLSAVLVFSASCRSTPAPLVEGTPGDGSTIVVEGDDLTGRLLDGLRVRVPSMLVTERSGQCPEIIFRGQRSMALQGSPSVYLDGTLMTDTCVLTQIPTSDVRTVEVYPGGITPRAGIQRNPFGIIMVFRLRA